MSPRVVLGGWYIDSTLDGEYCALVPHLKVVQTHAGEVPCPPGDEPLWLAIYPGKFAGQAHNSARTLEYLHGYGKWFDRPAACGTSPVIYDAAGALHISDCSIGSQGWRYVAPNGSLVTGDATLSSSRGLNEFTDLSDLQDKSILVGQGHDGGLVVWIDGTRRLLHPGACFDIRARRRGEQCVVSFYEVASDGLSAFIYTITLAELRALPLVQAAPAPPSQPAPQPVPPPTPETPVPFEQQMPNMLDVVKRVQREHPDEWAAREDLRFINRLAWELSRIDGRFGLLGKRMTDIIAADSISFLNGTVDPQLPTNLSCEAADVIGSSHSDTPTPVWNPITKPVREGGAGAKWIPATKPADVVQPAPTPTPTPTPTNPVPSPTAQTPGGLLDSMFASVLNRIAAQDEQITQLQRNNAILKARIDEQNDKIANLPSGGGGNVSIDGMRVAFKADNGKFLCADANKGGDVPVLANRDSAGGWETFTVVRR